MKNCSNCSENKDETLFYKNHNQCKECIKKINRNRHKSGNRSNDIEIVCKECNNKKNGVDFRFNRRKCIECEKVSGRKYRQDNKDKGREWVKNNRSRMSELQRNHHLKTREEKQENEKIRRQTDDIYNFRRKHKEHVNNYTKSIKSGFKVDSYSKDLNCHKKFFKSWIESNFIGDMNWDNYGTMWNIDHLIPMRLLNDENKNILTNHRNIKPVLVSHNLVKNGKILKSEILSHKNKYLVFIYTIDNDTIEYYKKMDNYLDTLNADFYIKL